jgi:hypothetical protein
MGTTMSEMASVTATVPLEKIDVPDEYYGVKVVEVGEDHDEGIVAFTHDRRRAIAAINRYVREQYQSRAEMIDLTPLWWQVYPTCPRTNDAEVSAWVGEKCGPDAPGAIPVLEGEVGFP